MVQFRLNLELVESRLDGVGLDEPAFPDSFDRKLSSIIQFSQVNFAESAFTENSDNIKVYQLHRTILKVVNLTLHVIS